MLVNTPKEVYFNSKNDKSLKSTLKKNLLTLLQSAFFLKVDLC